MSQIIPCLGNLDASIGIYQSSILKNAVIDVQLERRASGVIRCSVELAIEDIISLMEGPCGKLSFPGIGSPLIDRLVPAIRDLLREGRVYHWHHGDIWKLAAHR